MRDLSLLRRFMRAQPKGAGYPVHQLKVWCARLDGLTFWVAMCGEKGFQRGEPYNLSALLPHTPRCPLCLYATEGFETGAA